MIGFFPTIYPDELLYSQICKYHKRNGYPAYLYTCDDIYKHRTVHPDMEFLNAFTDDALTWITKQQPLQEVIEKHTMFPAYARFLPQERREQAFNALLQREGNWNNLLCVPNTGARYLRYCPECSREDREQYGETYWHREHQIQRIRVCPKHQCFLENSTVPMVSKATPGFFDAESNIPQDGCFKVCENKKEINFTDYLLQVFREDINLKSDMPIGVFLHNNLGKYVSVSGLVRDISGLYNDYLSQFKEMPTMEFAPMQKIFNCYRYDYYYICQLAYFLGISVSELTHLPKENKFYGMDVVYSELSKKYGIPMSTVRKMGKGILAYSRKKQYLQRKSGVRAREYEALDESMFPKVKQFVDDFLDKNKKPEKLSFAIVQRSLNLPQKQVNLLPKCQQYIKDHIESQAEFWARFLEWAVYDIEKNGSNLCFKQITNRLYIRRKDLQTAYPYIRDQYVKGVIRKMLPQANATTQQSNHE